MKKIIGFLLYLVSQTIASPVPINVDNFSVQSFVGTSDTSGTDISIINNSTLNFQDQSNPGNASISISNNSFLNFAEISSTTYSGQMTGTGIINKIGSGNLVMTGDNSGFTGDLYVQTGTLFLNESFGGNVSSSPSTLLVCDGSVLGNLNVGGVITLSGVNELVVGGNFTQSVNAVYIANLNYFGQSSLINIAGMANLSGFIQIDASQGVTLNQTYRVLHANSGVSGTYALINPYPLIHPFLTNDANNVYISFQSNLSIAAVTYNQQQVANQFDNLIPTNPDEALVLSSLLTLNPGDAQKALDELSGEHYSNFILSSLYDSGSFNKRIYESLSSHINHCLPLCEGVENWVSGGGGKGFQKKNSNAKGFHLCAGDINTGVQACIDPDKILGFALGYNTSSVYSDLGGKATLQTGNAAIYSLFQKKRLYVFADLMGGRTWGEFKRPINFGNINRSAHSDPRLAYGRFDLRLGADLGNCNCSIQTYLSGSCEFYHQEKIKEHNAQSLNLLIYSITKKLLSSKVGLFLGSNRTKKFSITLDLAWLHYYNNLDVHEKTRFKDFGTTFKIYGPNRNLDAGECSLVLLRRMGDYWDFFFVAEGELWKKWHSYEFNGGVCYRW